MNLKLNQKLLIIGAAIIAGGIVLVASTTTSSFFMIGQPSDSFSTITQTLSPGEAYTDEIEAQAGSNMTVTVEVQPSEVPMQLEIRQPGGHIISSFNFTEVTNTTFTPAVNGDYTIVITNLGNEQEASVEYAVRH